MNLPENYQIVNERGIYGFFKQYRFLSNFHPCDLIIGDIHYPSSEHAFMAYKTDNIGEKIRLSGIVKPSDVKKAGQLVTLRPDWEYYRVAAMLSCLYAKFAPDTELADMLLETGGKYLEETNWWHDQFWGFYKPQPGIEVFGGTGGLNMLGKCLMIVRNSLK